MISKQSDTLVYILTDVSSVNIFGFKQLNALKKSTFNIHVICGPGQIDRNVRDLNLEIHQVKYLQRNISFVNDIISLIKITSIVYSIRPHIIIYSTPKASLMGAVAGLLTKTPIKVYQIFGARWQSLKFCKKISLLFIDILILKISTNITAVSRSIATKYSALTYKTIKVLHFGSTIGVDTKIFFPSINENFRMEKFRLGYAGRLASDKGIEDLIDLFIKLNSKNTNFELEIIGDVDQTDKISLDTIEKITLHPKISWFRAMTQIKLADHFRSWDLQLFLSKREGLGNVVLEAGACGIPTFCWDIDGVRDAIPNQFNRFKIIYGDLAKMENEILNYYNRPLSLNDRNLLANWYKINFDQDEVLNAFTKLITSLMKSSLDYE